MATFKSTPTGMERKITLTPAQIKQLDIASQRVASGSGNATDRANIAYAQGKGYSYSPVSAPTQTMEQANDPATYRGVDPNLLQQQSAQRTALFNTLPSSQMNPPTGAYSQITRDAGLLPSNAYEAVNPQTPDISPIDGFNQILLGMLEKSKGVNADELLKRRRALQRASIGKSEAITPEELRTLSPEQQDSMRSGDIKALRPDIDENAFQIQQAETATKNFEDVFDKVRVMSQEYADKMVAPDSVIQSYKSLIEADPENMSTYIAKVNDKTRDKILQALDYNKMKPKVVVEPPKTITSGNDTLQYNPETGTWDKIDTGGGATADENAVKQATDILYRIKQIENSPGFKGAVGAKGITSFFGLKEKPVAGSAAASTFNQISSLKSLLVIDNLKLMKGVLTDRDVEVLSKAGTALDISMKESDFKNELTKIKQYFQIASQKSLRPKFDALNTGVSYDEAVKKYGEDGLLKIIEASGQSFSGGGGGTPIASSGMRTDRHNNPTAFTTDIARVAGLKEGVDYTKGDPFSGGKYYTARLTGDPIATTIKVINKIGFYTGSGGQRWTHTAMPQSQWNKLSYAQKANVIKQMYQKEGGVALKGLFNNIG